MIRLASSVILLVLLSGGSLASQNQTNTGAQGGALATGTYVPSHAEIWHTIRVDLRNRGLNDEDLPSPENVDYAGVVPVKAGGSLEVSSIAQELALHYWQFRLRCNPVRACLPFFVRVRWHEQPSGQLGHKLSSLPKLARPSAYAVPSGAANDLESAQPLLVRAGQPARLLMEGAGMRISVPVICLERGAKGQQIRARSRESGLVFRARVTAEGVLAVSLPLAERNP